MILYTVGLESKTDDDVYRLYFYEGTDRMDTDQVGTYDSINGQ